MFKKAEKQDNFLHYVPVKCDSIRWEKHPNGNTVILIDRNSLLERIIRRFYKTPEVMRIELDSYGSFVWQTIDGHQNVLDICNHLKTHFGSDVEPLYERLSTYMKILRNNGFVMLCKPQ